MISVTLTKTKETKGTYVYTADTEESDDVLSTLYIKKQAFKGKEAPRFITVNIIDGQSESNQRGL